MVISEGERQRGKPEVLRLPAWKMLYNQAIGVYSEGLRLSASGHVDEASTRYLKAAELGEQALLVHNSGPFSEYRVMMLVAKFSARGGNLTKAQSMVDSLTKSSAIRYEEVQDGLEEVIKIIAEKKKKAI